jgi:drug/metabolite transporter (DMT)-like permease
VQEVPTPSGVRGMALVQHHHLGSDHHFVRRAWIALALIPVGVALAIVLAFAGGEHGDNANRLAGAALSVLALAPAAAAVFFAVLAERAGEHSAGAVLAVTMVVGVLVLLALPLLVVSGEAVLIAAAVCLLAVAAIGFVRSRRAHD